MVSWWALCMYMYAYVVSICNSETFVSVYTIHEMVTIQDMIDINRMFASINSTNNISLSNSLFLPPSLPLSSDSANGFIHLRIVQETDSSNQLGYVLGQFSSHFSTVAECIAFYTKQRLNIRGAEHKKLRYPVPRASDTVASFRVWMIASEIVQYSSGIVVQVSSFLVCWCNIIMYVCLCAIIGIIH